MNETDFIQKGSGRWLRLSELTSKGVTKHSLSGAELDELLVLYLQVSKDLALARTQDANYAIQLRLNDLVLQAYGVLYRRPKKSIVSVGMDALKVTAQSVRRRAVFVWIAASLFILFSILTAVFSANSHAVKEVLLPPGMAQNAQAWLKGFPPRSSAESGSAMGMYASNNPLASLLGAGLTAGTFGFGALTVLFENGANMGVLAMMMAKAGKLPFLLLSIFPHGVPELSGFMISCGSGMSVGWALLCPGNKTRIQSVLEAGKDAVPMLAASVVLMWIAAPIEGWFSYDPRIPLVAKGVFGAVEVVAWGLFWTFCGRERPATDAKTAVNPLG